MQRGPPVVQQNHCHRPLRMSAFEGTIHCPKLALHHNRHSWPLESVESNAHEIANPEDNTFSLHNIVGAPLPSVFYSLTNRLHVSHHAYYSTESSVCRKTTNYHLYNLASIRKHLVKKDVQLYYTTYFITIA